MDHGEASTLKAQIEVINVMTRTTTLRWITAHLSGETFLIWLCVMHILAGGRKTEQKRNENVPSAVNLEQLRGKGGPLREGKEEELFRLKHLWNVSA